MINGKTAAGTVNYGWRPLSNMIERQTEVFRWAIFILS